MKILRFPFVGDILEAFLHPFSNGISKVPAVKQHQFQQ